MIGNRLKSLRENKGLSQRDLAKVIQVSPSTVAMYELDQRSPDNDTIIKLSDFFNISADYLLGRTDILDHIKPDNLEEIWPNTVSVLRRAGRPPTPEEEERIARIMAAAIPDPENDKYHPTKKK